MPVGFRGLIVAGVFATMMGSTSAALNALATSFTKDFYLPYINPAATDPQAIRAARIATAVFGILMILVATPAAYPVLKDPKLTIIPIAIGILGYTYGALLGVFLLGMLTRTRGADKTNIIGMLIGVVAVLVLCKVELPIFGATLKFGRLHARSGGPRSLSRGSSSSAASSRSPSACCSGHRKVRSRPRKRTSDRFLRQLARRGSRTAAFRQPT